MCQHVTLTTNVARNKDDRSIDSRSTVCKQPSINQSLVNFTPLPPHMPPHTHTLCILRTFLGLNAPSALAILITIFYEWWMIDVFVILVELEPAKWWVLALQRVRCIYIVNYEVSNCLKNFGDLRKLDLSDWDPKSKFPNFQIVNAWTLPVTTMHAHGARPQQSSWATSYVQYMYCTRAVVQ